MHFANYETYLKYRHIDPVIAIELDILANGLFPHHDDKLKEFPPSLHKYCGKGVGIWQYPNQFSAYCNNLLSQDIKSYLEIGIAAGGTFRFITEFLSRFGNLESSTAVDIAAPGQTLRGGKNIFTSKFVTWLEGHDIAKYINAESDEYNQLNDQKFDLIMIDGDHSYEGAFSDFARFKDSTSKMVFHDIVNSHTPGVSKLWSEIINGQYRTVSKYFEYVDQYDELPDDYMGIGVVLFS